MQTGDPVRTLPLLERALYENVSDPKTGFIVADTSFALARALAATNGDMQRARRLAEQAIAHYTSFQTTQRDAAAAWLAAHR